MKILNSNYMKKNNSFVNNNKKINFSSMKNTAP